MEYFCNKCNYGTNKKSDFIRHQTSQKHIKNSQIIYKCEKCEAEYIVRSSYYAHRKKCQNNCNNLEKINNSKLQDPVEHNIKIQLLKKDLENEKIRKDLEIEKIKNQHEKEKVKMLKDIIKNSNKTTDTALKITSKTISALKYANEHFKDAPALIPIENYNMMNYDLNDEEDKKKLMEDILFYYKKNSLHTIFGKHIISEYKKDDVNEQSLHTTDTSRMNYIIKTKKDDNLTKWYQDKNGVIICSNIIDKLINYHIDIIKWYHQQLVQELSLDPIRPNTSVQNKVVNISNLLNDIESGELKKETNKYIAPFFNLDK